MKISFDKALLWLLPYLYLVSVLYYWGYWGQLKGDGISYYPTSEFLRGVINPISGTFFFILVMVALFFVFKIIVLNFKITRGALLFLLITWSAILLIILVTPIPHINVADFSLVDKEFVKLPISLELMRISLVGLSGIVSVYISRKINKFSSGDYDSYFNKLGIIIILCTFPVLAYTDGRVRAWRITANQSYDYTLLNNPDLAPTGVYKYLGRAGDYYFFMTLNNREQIVISADKLNSVTVAHYWVGDKDNVSLFAEYQARLIKLKSRQVTQAQ